MSGIFFYSILIFILLSIFVPSIYAYAYKCFIGRVVLVLLIIYFSKHSMILGLIFVTIIIITSYPLYEGFASFGFSPDSALAKNLIVTSNYSIKDKTSKDDVFNYFTKYYCNTDSNGRKTINTEKSERWGGILKKINPPADKDSSNLASNNLILQRQICTDTGEYYQNYNNNWNSAYPNGYSSVTSGVNPNTIDGCATNYIDQNRYCGYWAYIGECSRNPGYMLYRCKASCNRVSGNTSNSVNHVLSFPQCLYKNLDTKICKDNSIKNILSSAQNVSNNPKLNPYFQQDGQWLLNMYGQLCETSPVI
jgi:hypothetical protein